MDCGPGLSGEWRSYHALHVKPGTSHSWIHDAFGEFLELYEKFRDLGPGWSGNWNHQGHLRSPIRVRMDAMREQNRRVFDWWRHQWDDVERTAQREVIRLRAQLIQDPGYLRKLERYQGGIDDALGREWEAADKALQYSQAIQAIYGDVMVWVESMDARGLPIINNQLDWVAAQHVKWKGVYSVVAGALLAWGMRVQVRDAAGRNYPEEPKEPRKIKNIQTCKKASNIEPVFGPGNGHGTLTGPRTQIPPLSDAATTRSLIRENQSADILVQAGYNVEQNPVLSGLKNPDYRVNGVVFDNYAPETGSVRNIWSTVEGKVQAGQTNNVVINLADSSADVGKLNTQFNSYPIQNLNHVIVIDQNGNVTHMAKGH